MNRCQSFTINNRRCRTKVKDNLLFCCKSHEPINKEIIEDGCFLCMEKIENSNEILFMKCFHAFHKKCYMEWLNFSTYDEPICIICRDVAFHKKHEKIRKIENIDTTKIDEILNILKIKKKCDCCYGKDCFIKIFEPKTPDTSPPSTPSL